MGIKDLILHNTRHANEMAMEMQFRESCDVKYGSQQNTERKATGAQDRADYHMALATGNISQTCGVSFKPIHQSSWETELTFLFEEISG